MAVFHLKYRDTRPILEVALLDPDGAAHDLTGATSIKLHIRLRSGTTITRTLTPDADPTKGITRYTWLATDWDAGNLAIGTHSMEYEVVAGASRLTWPNDGLDELRIVEDLGQG
jgi:hypothetical protein